ncbi:Immunity protein 40 [Pedobacter westerhofensis]|uniref:Immunity protein 40 n=1 Tax=Pedobacter westerhofensis TaxID=425512 RepID=A0A521C692_9SPHI|nr:Imm40 family immunity protein [Pedobacter westerhofensis]SMO54913.1 Immunity protein 40 [Pedobacter westerhofensis]
MKTSIAYFDLVKEKGLPLSEINPGSDEMALSVKDALEALELLRDSKVAVLGGDIYTQVDNQLIYAYKLWGEKYVYLNWYCDKVGTENEAEYLLRSYITAKESIVKAFEISKELEKSCYIVLVIEE